MENRLKVLFLTPTSLREYHGIDKKVLFQYEALRKKGLDIDLCFWDRQENYNISRKILKNEVILKHFKSKNKYTRKLFTIYLSWNFNDILKYILGNKINLVYIRYEYASNYGFIKFLKRLKENNIIILIEIPTYPYDQELLRVSLRGIIKYFIDKYYRRFLYKYVHRIITFSNDNEIYGIKTIKINNGIDIKKISLITREKEKLVKEINFIGVAGLALWHGFDRFILSMAEYYRNIPKEIIKFHIVGDGDTKIVNDLKKLVLDNKLEKYVIFYGYKSGKDLNEIYNKADIAVGSLGFSRIGLKEGSPLKIREYIAKGLPVILGYDDMSLKNTLDSIYQVPNDESTFDLNKILCWYRNLDKDPVKIRKYAEDNLTWDKQMKKVVDYILEAEEKERC